MRVGENQKKAARVADLYGYLLQYHPDTVKSAGQNRLQNVEHDSLIITKGLGYVHNSRGESGNSIDYLMRYLGYSFQRAVAALATFDGVYQIDEKPTTTKTHQIVKNGLFQPPKRFEGRFSRTFAYLTNTRKLDAKIVQDLIEREMLYEEDSKHNAVFISKHCDYAEVEGTLSDKKFKGTAKNSDYDGYWIYIPSGVADTEVKKIFVCESAIDAISLYQLQRMDEEEFQFSGYLSTGGAAKDAAFDRAKEDFSNAEFIVATDADPAGNDFAMRHKYLKRIIPDTHDWNDTLVDRENLPY